MKKILKKIPLCIPSLDKREEKAVIDVLRSGWLAHGPKNEEFEEMFAHFIGAKYAVSMNSCASALFVALKAHNITGEVILPSFTFVASAHAIVNAGATPVFADINYETGNIDPADIEKKITNKTQAIMPVHFAGGSADMTAIMQIAKKHNLIVIEDSAEAIGASWNGKMAGSFSTGCFSFFATKNITTGEGGMLTTNDAKIAEFARAYIGHGISSTTHAREKASRPWLRSAIMSGYNFRMSNFAAALGVEQMKKLTQLNRERIEAGEYLNKKLSLISGVEVPKLINKTDIHVYQTYTIRVKENRDRMVMGLRERGIGASVHFDPPVHLQDYYLENYPIKKGSLPNTERLSETIISLPLYPGISKADLDRIVKAIKELI